MITLLRSLFFRPPILQVAALCLREGPELLLIQSLDTKRWILPKGWPMRGKSLAEAAAIEAWEEAGVKGDLQPKSIGQYQSRKRGVGNLWQASEIEVFVLDVTSQSKNFPEAHKRNVKWFPPDTALENLHDPDLCTLIKAHLDAEQGG